MFMENNPLSLMLGIAKHFYSLAFFNVVLFSLFGISLTIRYHHEKKIVKVVVTEGFLTSLLTITFFSFSSLWTLSPIHCRITWVWRNGADNSESCSDQNDWLPPRSLQTAVRIAPELFLLLFLFILFLFHISLHLFSLSAINGRSIYPHSTSTAPHPRMLWCPQESFLLPSLHSFAFSPSLSISFFPSPFFFFLLFPLSSTTFCHFFWITPSFLLPLPLPHHSLSFLELFSSTNLPRKLVGGGVTSDYDWWRREGEGSNTGWCIHRKHCIQSITAATQHGTLSSSHPTPHFWLEVYQTRPLNRTPFSVCTRRRFHSCYTQSSLSSLHTRCIPCQVSLSIE